MTEYSSLVFILSVTLISLLGLDPSQSFSVPTSLITPSRSSEPWSRDLSRSERMQDDEEEDDESLESGSGSPEETRKSNLPDHTYDEEAKLGCFKCTQSSVGGLASPRNLSVKVSKMLVKGNRCRTEMHFYWLAPINDKNTLRGFDVLLNSSSSPYQRGDCFNLRLPRKQNYTNTTIFTYKFRVPHNKRAEEYVVKISANPCSQGSVATFPPLPSSDTEQNECNVTSTPSIHDVSKIPASTVVITETFITSELSDKTTNRVPDKEEDKTDDKSFSGPWSSLSIAVVITVTSLVIIIVAILVIITGLLLARKMRQNDYVVYGNISDTSPQGSTQCILEFNRDPNCTECGNVRGKFVPQRVVQVLKSHLERSRIVKAESL